MNRAKTKINLIFALILAIGLFLRLFKLNQRPICLSNDEVAFGYNAFSILETGKDEYGKKLPLIFKSIGDAKLPFTIYITTIPVKLFGLNEFSVRLPSAFFGIVGVAAIYFLVSELTSNPGISLLSSFVLAISPWHLRHSRSLYDANISLGFVLIATLCFVKSAKRQGNHLVISFVLFAAAIYTYYSDRLFVPLFFLGLSWIYRKEISKFKLKFLKASLVGIIILSPLISTLITSPDSAYKISITTIFHYTPADEEIAKLKSQDSKLTYTLFHNSYIDKSLLIARRYLNHFSPIFLFVSGTHGDPKQANYGMGELYWTDALFILLGITAVIGQKQSNFKKLVFLWLILGPVPAAITRDEYHGRRALEMLIPLSIFTATGINQLILYIRKHSNYAFKVGASITMSCLYVYAFCFYILSYYIFSPLNSDVGPAGWSCGYKELVSTIVNMPKKYEKIVIDTSYQNPYLFFLFYSKYSPAKYQPQAKLIIEPGHNLGESPGFDNLEFRPIYWPADRGESNTLFAAPPDRIPLKDIDPKQARLLETINFPDGNTAFYVVETEKLK